MLRVLLIELNTLVAPIGRYQVPGWYHSLYLVPSGKYKNNMQPHVLRLVNLLASYVAIARRP